MNKPSWDTFRSRENQELVFEKDVARRLFCHEAGVAPSDLTCPPNYAGIENVPVQTSFGWVAFQAKHSRSGRQNGNAFNKLRKVIEPVTAGDYKLDKIYCFSSGVAPDTSTALTAEQKRVVADLKAEGISVEWYYEDRILTILEDAKDSNLVRASQAFFEDIPQPILDRQDRTENPQGFRQFRFSERQSEFAGRDQELQQLREFTDSEGSFSWWHVTGPGLSGKSRLLLEHCRGLENWHWGWLENELLTFSFSNWLPDKDTFIVIDYALGREPAIQRLFQEVRASTQSDRFVHKVRLVLLEREYSGWLRAIEHVPGIGNWLAGQKFRADGLALDRLPNALAAIDSFPSGEFMVAVGELLERERQRRWQEVTREAHGALVLATAAGGFSLEELPDQLRPETLAWLGQLNCSEDVARMIGAPHSPNRYDPLQPDVFGELYVLESIRNAIPSARPAILRQAYELNPSGFINFLYRCAQSFPDHPSLIDTIDDWSFNDESRMAYLAALANSLDLVPISQAQRINTYRTIMSAMDAPSGNLIFVERAIFGKILALFPGNTLYIEPAEIQLRPPVEIEPASSDPDLLNNLLPAEYCDALLGAWRQIGREDQIALLGPHIVEIFHHKLIRLLAIRPHDLVAARNLLAELSGGLETAGGARYAATILAFQGLCANTIAALVQYGHNSQEALDWADEIRDLASSHSTLERNGQALVCQSSNLDRIDLGLTILAAHSQNRGWEYKFECMEAIRCRGLGIQADNPLKKLHYTQAAVQITSGFSGEDQAQKVREVLQRCREYTISVGSPQIAEAFAMMLSNLNGYASTYDLGQTSPQFLVEAAEWACRYPDPEHGIVRVVLARLGSEFQDSLNRGDLETARNSLNTARQVVEAANNFPHEDASKLHPGTFFDSPIYRYVQGEPAFYDDAKEMAQFLSASDAVNWRQVMSNINAFSRYFSEGQKALNTGDVAKANRALEVLTFFASIDPHTDYQPVISILQDGLDNLA